MVSTTITPITPEQTVERDCADCGRAISEKRLRAKPDAEYCIDCQPRHDERVVAIHSVPQRIEDFDAADFALVTERVAGAHVKWDELPAAD